MLPVVARRFFQALLISAAIVWLLRLGLHTVVGQRIDDSAFGAIGDLEGSFILSLRRSVPFAMAAIVAVLAMLALVRGRWRTVAITVGFGVVALAGSQVLRDFVIERPDLGEFGYPHNTVPSTHTVVTAALATGALWLVQSGFMRLVLALAGVAAIVLNGLASVGSFAHRPLDVVVACLLVAALASLCADWRPPRSPSGWILVAVALAAVAATTWMAVDRLREVAASDPPYVDLMTIVWSFVAAALVVVVAAWPGGSQKRSRAA